MSETFKLETEQTILCDDCAHTIPSGPVWFCPNCLANLCDECYNYHHCDI
ncbi:MAG: hypothetical protein ACE5KU_05585 [Nitrososphaerales archaeon]